MANHQRSFSVDANGLTFDDQVYVFAGTDLPWNITGAENYPEGTRYFRTNGDEYVKGYTGSNPLQDDYVLRPTGTVNINEFTIVEKAINYTASLWEIVVCDASSGDLTITIPSATLETHSQMAIKIAENGTSDNYTVRVITPDGSLFEGEEDMLLEVRGTSQTLISDGQNWRAI